MVRKIMKPGIRASVTFYSSEQGGRQSPIVRDTHNCIFTIAGQNFDCRLFCKTVIPIRPGDHVVVPIKFLCPDLVLPLLKEEARFTLRESRVLAEGIIQQVL
jgi:hypothetical protein